MSGTKKIKVSEKTQEIVKNNKESDKNMIECVECGKKFKEEEMILNGYGNHVCEDCIDNYECCEDCGEYFDRDEMHYVNSGSGYYICDDCKYNGDYYYCDDCGELYYQDDLSYNERDDCSYCDNCYDRHDYKDRVGEWHDHKDDYLEFHKLDSEEEPRYYVGIETETIPNNYTRNEDEFLDNLENNFLPCYFERDGSLGDCGVEIITEPCSPNYIYKNVENIKKAFDKGIELGYRSDTDSSAVHIHVSRPENEEVIDRVWFILETFKDQVIQVARRHSSSYAQFISDTIYDVDNDYRQSLKFIKDNKSGKGRYMALNLTNNDTIEFRIFRGTLNTSTWVAYIQFVDNIMQVAYDLDKDLEDIKWEDLIKGEYISEYVKNRGIKCDIKVVDNSKRLQEIEDKNNKIVDNVMNIIDEMWLKPTLFGIKSKFELSGKINDMYSQTAHVRYAINDWKDMYDMVRNIQVRYTLNKKIDRFRNDIKDSIVGANIYRSEECKIKDNILQMIIDALEENN